MADTIENGNRTQQGSVELTPEMQANGRNMYLFPGEEFCAFEGSSDVYANNEPGEQVGVLDSPVTPIDHTVTGANIIYSPSDPTQMLQANSFRDLLSSKDVEIRESYSKEESHEDLTQTLCTLHDIESRLNR